VLDKIEALNCPTVALIHGFCMGGGMELALACRYRIADDGPKTTLSLPEVQLGIHPGFGGTVRLPPLIGAPAAMDLMLTGKPVNAKKAKKLGMIDYAVPTRQFKEAAHQIVVERPKPRRASRLQALSNHSLVRPFLAKAMRKQVAKKAKKDHYPAPYAMIDLWLKYMDKPKTMMVEEAKSVARLVTGDTSRNLVKVFFLRERLKNEAKGDKSIPKAKHVHVVGAGVMGGDIAAWCALKGLDVTLQDRSPEIIAKALQRAHKLYSHKLRDNRLVTLTMDRLVPDVKGLGVPKADIIIEAIVENIDAKKGLYKELEAKMKPGALLTTNTSSIPLEVLSEGLKKPDELVGLHFFNPVAQMPLIEIVKGKNTNEQAAQRVSAFAAQISKLPLPVKSSPGFLVNRILMPYMMEAVRLKEEGKPALQIDKCATDFGMPMGPLFLADTVGLDICLSVATILSKELGLDVPESLKKMVEKGNLGVKSGQGFYHYTKGKRDKSKEEAGSVSPEITDRLIGRMINEAVACLREGVVGDEELLDAGVIFGTGFAPFRGGPMNYVYNQGVNTFVDKLHDLEKRHGSFFHADDGWTRLSI
ncbi:MAG: 3-hydroxyacyl-CoA dehydrogenase NAD-binding domain-containing protein, partial [Gammaproteobacteria bacterium]|nr:3-hydroxyacyl-CoA dehydrogenase NAD-binding domain-containing protein [Gammaproteobacteria bacterium]